MISPYRGVTYPRIFDNQFVRKFWKKYMCPKGIHLLDECWSPSGGFLPADWYLSCDACNLEIHINKISEVNCK